MIDVALTTLLRTPAGGPTRVAPGTERVQVTPGTLPRVIYTLIDTERDYTDDGSGLVRATYQLDLFASTLSAATALAKAIRLAMDNYTGTVDSTPILRIYFQGERFSPAEQMPGAQQTACRFVMTMFVDYREPSS
jgi:hypothetical protein